MTILNLLIIQMNPKISNKKIFHLLIILLVFFVIFIISFFVVPKMLAMDYQNSGNYLSNVLENFVPEEVKPKINHVKVPEAVKTIYMTACVAATPTLRANLVKLIEETEINSVIIDIKDFSGTISFKTDNPKLLGTGGTGCKAADMFDFIKTLHEKDIYVIGRITVFQDPFYTKIRPDLAVQKKSDGSTWKDFKGISFIDVGAKEYWDYVLEIAFESHKNGFDELNFDYIRFPSDGNMKDIYFPISNKILIDNPVLGKQIALENFFKYLSDEISKYNKDQEFPLITSADLFGMVTTNTDDLNIGQVMERTLPYFDYIAPMVYPSHYPAHFNGWADPNKYPYELIKFVMSSAVDRVISFSIASSTPEDVRARVSKEQLRPWLQDFDYGGNYDVAEVKAQIKATYDAGLDSWMLWSPSNRYTRGALEDANEIVDINN
jgi:hypothetical protein